MNPKIDHNSQVVEQFSLQAESYAGLTRAQAAPTDRSAALRALIAPKPADTALDIACGPGSLALEIAPHVGHVTGIDLTPAMLDQARAAQARSGVANVDWRIGDSGALPFDDAGFSLVMCRAAFHHFEDPRTNFAEMLRVCAPGGRIVVIDVTPAPEKSAAYDRIERLRDPSHSHALTIDELHALGTGLPLSTPIVSTSIAADIPLDAVLATSFPDACSIEDIAARFRDDALSGEDRYGFTARMIDGRVYLSYPMTTALWVKR